MGAVACASWKGDSSLTTSTKHALCGILKNVLMAAKKISIEQFTSSIKPCICLAALLPNVRLALKGSD